MKLMARNILFILGMVSLMMVSRAEAEEPNVYSNPKYRYEINVLPGWTIKEKSAEDVMLFSLSEVCSIWISMIPVERSDSYGEFLLDLIDDEEARGIANTLNRAVLENFPEYKIEYTRLSTTTIAEHRVIETMFFPKDEKGEKSPILVTGIVREKRMILLLSKAENVVGMNRDLDEVVKIGKSLRFTNGI